MKLQSLFPVTEEIDLLEGATFGQKQASEVRSRNNAMIGVEYEYTIDEEYVEGSGQDDDRIGEIFREMRDERQSEIKNELEERIDANDSMSIVGAAFAINQLSVIKGRIEQLLDLDDDNQVQGNQMSLIDIDQEAVQTELENLEYYIARATEQQQTIEEFASNMEDTFQTIDFNNSYIEHNDIEMFAEKIGDLELIDLSAGMNETPPDYQELANEAIDPLDDFLNSEEVQLIVGDFIEVEDSTQEQETRGLRSKVHQVIDDWADNLADELVEEQENQIWDDAREHAEEAGIGGGNADDVSDAARSLLQNNAPDLWKQVRKHHPDGPGPLAESATYKMPLNEAIDYMYEMHDFISTYGSTSPEDGEAGMHVNVSFKDIEMSQENFNAVKLAVLMNDGYVEQLFPARQYTGVVWPDDAPRFLTDIVSQMASRAVEADAKNLRQSFDAFEEHLRKSGNFSGKVTNINIGGVTPEWTDESRVEFRFFGGEDYDKRTQEIEFNIYRAVYFLEAAFSPDFLQEEYMKAAYKIIEDWSQEFFGVSLAEAMKMFHSAHAAEKGDNFEEMVARRPGDIKTIYSRMIGGRDKAPDVEDVASGLVNSHKEDFYELLEDLFTDLTNVIVKTNVSQTRELRQRLPTNLKAITASAYWIPLLSAIREKNTSNNSRDILEFLSIYITKEFLEEADREMLKRFNEKDVLYHMASEVEHYVSEFLTQRNNRLLDQFLEAAAAIEM